MNLWVLAVRSLRFHWRAHLGALLGATVSTAILVGALAVGDSVRYSLRALALARLGEVRLALNGQGRCFRAALAEELASELQAPVAPILLLRGTAANEEMRVGRVQVVGVSAPFWRLGRSRPLIAGAGESVAINEPLARRLGAHVGDDLLLRVERPSLLSRDAPLSSLEESTVTLRLSVAAIATDAGFGRFSLEANQVPPATAFVPLELLQRRIRLPGRANVLLVGAAATERRAPGASKAPTVAAATGALRRRWQLADAGLELRELRGPGLLELRTDRVFLDPPVEPAARNAAPGARGVLSYFVNELRVGRRSTPYSVVAALEGRPAGVRGADPMAVATVRMRDDEIVVNRWLADDVQATVGDPLRLTYFVVGPMRRLLERSSVFRVRAIVPVVGAAADRELMPVIPGLTDRKHCRDWEPGIPIDLEKIRDKDERYWNDYRGTPKAFITLRAGQRIWANRFGDLTAVRYSALGAWRLALRPTKAVARRLARAPAPAVAKRRAPSAKRAIEDRLRQRLDPASLGLSFSPVREQALAAGSQAMDFGMLFLGFSLFLIAAALLLTALLFTFGVEQRRQEIGTLLALGFRPQRVQRLLLMEGAVLALVAAVAGAAAGVLYTRAVIHGLATVWRGAVANAALQFFVEPTTLAMGASAGFVVALSAIFLVTRKQARDPARLLLAGEATTADDRVRRRGRSSALVLLSVAGTLVLIGAGLRGEPAEQASLFFGAGTLLLIGTVAACGALFSTWRRGTARRRLTLGSLGVRNIVRRPGRSLAVVGLLACGSFLVIAVGANRHDPYQEASRRPSGTGGFALYGESALPVYVDLNGPEGRDTYALDAQSLQGVQIVALRLRPGDDASCLNLNRPQVPRLLGVDPDALARRAAFTFAQQLRGPAGSPGAGSGGWRLLEEQQADGAVPAVGDMNTVVWSLGKSLGDELSYQDDRGRVFPIRIVGILANSILQGSLLISERNFTARFPSQEGYQVFLIDAPVPIGAAVPTSDGRPATASVGSNEARRPAERSADLSRVEAVGGRPPAVVTLTLTRALEDVGLELTAAPERLAAFNTVENTYLSIFAALGGLGLLLGSLGLGVVALRNVLERRAELALLRAVGFRRAALQWLLFSEAALLLTLGLLSGVGSALIAALPALRSPGAAVPVVSLTVTLVAVFASGFLWTWGATWLALRGPLLAALRSE
jgi:putative ABC transport system permease protein